MRFLLFVLTIVLFSCNVEPQIAADDLKEGTDRRRVFYITPKQVKREAYRQGRYLSGEARRALPGYSEDRHQHLLDSIGKHYHAGIRLLQSQDEAEGHFEKSVYTAFYTHMKPGFAPDSVVIYDTSVVYMKPFLYNEENKGIWKIRMSRAELMKSARVN